MSKKTTKESLQEEKDKTAFFDAVLKDIETPITSNSEQRGSRSEKKIEGEMLAIATKVCLKALAGSLDQKTASRLIETQTSAEN